MNKQIQLGEVSLAVAKKLNTKFVQACLDPMKFNGDLSIRYKDLWKAKRGQLVLVEDHDFRTRKSTFKVCRVSSVGQDFIGEAKVRVTDNKFSWRVSHMVILDEAKAVSVLSK